MNGKKISAHIAGAALASIAVWLLGQFAKIVVPAEVAASFGTLTSLAVILLMPDKVEE